MDKDLAYIELFVHKIDHEFSDHKRFATVTNLIHERIAIVK